MSSFARAIFFIILAILLFDIQGAIIKVLGKELYSVPQIATFRNLFGLIPAALVLYYSAEWKADRKSGKTPSLYLPQWRLALLRGLSISLAQYSFYTSITLMPLATASTLAFAGPMFITALSVPLLGHHVGLTRWSAVVIGFVGIVMVMKPEDGIFQPVALLPVCAAFFYGLSSVMVRQFSDASITASINLYTTLGALFCSTTLMLISGAYSPVQSAEDWLWMGAMGLVGGFAVLTMVIAYRLTQPSNLSPFEYFGIPFSFIIGYVFFGESPFGELFPGVFFIIAGGLLIVWRERRLQGASQKPPKKAADWRTTRR